MDNQMFAGGVRGAEKQFLVLVDSKKLFSHVSPESLIGILTEEERDRATRLGNENVRRRYIASRVLLRLLIREFTGAPPPERLFTDSGPPVDIRCEDGDYLRFSLSHSRCKTLIGVSKGNRLGVDIETLRPVKDMQRLIAYAFSDEENRWFAGLPLHLSAHAFFRLWTRKEAVVKYYKGTIAGDMHRFSVPLLAGAGAHTIKPGLYGDTGELQLIDFELPGQLFGALCREGDDTEANAAEIDYRWVKGHLPGPLNG